MVVKIMLENTEDLRWVAILLDKSPPQMMASVAFRSPSGSHTASSLDTTDLVERADGAHNADEEEVA